MQCDRSSGLSWTCTLLVLVAAAGVTSDAYGYIDPGTGGILLQVLLGAAFGALFYAKRAVNFIRGMYSKFAERQ